MRTSTWLVIASWIYSLRDKNSSPIAVFPLFWKRSWNWAISVLISQPTDIPKWWWIRSWDIKATFGDISTKWACGSGLRKIFIVCGQEQNLPCDIGEKYIIINISTTIIKFKTGFCAHHLHFEFQDRNQILWQNLKVGIFVKEMNGVLGWVAEKE